MTLPSRVTGVAGLWLAAALISTTVAASTTVTASASNAPYSITDIGPAPPTEFRISDIGAVPTLDHDSSETPGAAAVEFTVSDISPG